MTTNHRPVTYTERVSVALTAPQRESLRAYARERETAISIVLREAALEHIGRVDLSLAEETAFPVGKNLERKRSKPASRFGARALVNLTRAQKLALELAAELEGVAVTALLRDAGLRKAGIRSPKPTRMGRPLGSPSRNR